MDMIVHLRSPQGMFIQGDGRYVGNNGEDGIEFTQHKDNPTSCGVLIGYRPEGVYPDGDLFKQMLGGKSTYVDPGNIALVIVIGEARQ